MLNIDQLRPREREILRREISEKFAHKRNSLGSAYRHQMLLVGEKGKRQKGR